MPTQNIETLQVKELHLWTENPRDPIDIKATDYEIIQRAVNDPNAKWDLPKFVKEMGEYYDLSELPTVVVINGKYVVYDGNRRITILKYLQDDQIHLDFGGGLFRDIEPQHLVNLTEIPCNVCDLDTALINIERKHTSNGTWKPLERDYFLHRHRKQEKSLFLIFEESTGLISKNPTLNRRFVKDEVLTLNNLEEIGLSINPQGELISIYDEQTTNKIFESIIKLIEGEHITTRKNRGQLKQSLKVLDQELGEKIVQFNKTTSSIGTTYSKKESEKSPKQTPVEETGSPKREKISKGTIKTKPDLKRKQIPATLKKIIDECYTIDNDDFANSKLAISRVAFECVMKYVIENTLFQGSFLSKNKHFIKAFEDSSGHIRPYTNFETLRKNFIEIIKNIGIKKAFENFNLDNLHQIIHNYNVGAIPGDAKATGDNLIPLIEFMLQNEADLLSNLDTSKLI